MQTVTVVVCINYEQSLFCGEERKKTGRARYSWDESPRARGRRKATRSSRLCSSRARLALRISYLLSFMTFFPADFRAKERLFTFYGLHGLVQILASCCEAFLQTLAWNWAPFLCSCRNRITRGVIRYGRGRRWYRVPTRRLRIRLKGGYRRARRVGKTIRVVYRRKITPIRFVYGKVRFFYKRRWRRPSTRRGRRRRRRRRRKRLRRYWRRLRRRRRRRYGRRNGRMMIKYGKRYRRVFRRGRRFWFRVGRKKYGLR